MKLSAESEIKYAREHMDNFITAPKDAESSLNHPSYTKFREQTELNESEGKKIWSMLMKSCNAVYQAQNAGASTDGSEQELFQDVVEAIAQNELLSTNGKELALWSGGFDMSLIAQEMGYCPLEVTPFGKFLNTTAITSLWKVEAKLWNALSKKFVEKYNIPDVGKKAVHVFFATVDDASVLLRQEVPQLDQDKLKYVVHWHPICWTNPHGTTIINRYSEIGIVDNGALINIAQYNRGFVNGASGMSEKAAFECWKNKLKSLNPEYTRRARVSTSLDLNLPPFALYDED